MPDALLSRIDQLRREAAGSIRERIWEEMQSDPQRYLKEVSQALGLVAVDEVALQTIEPRFDLIGFAECNAHHCVLGEVPEHGLLLVLDDPFDPNERIWALQRCPQAFRFAFSTPGEVGGFLKQAATEHRALSQVTSIDGNADGGEQAFDISLKTLANETHPVIRLVDSSIYDAIQSRASDIHIEATSTGLVVKYRIDGVLLEGGGAAGVEIAEQAISRLKIMAELDIGERRVPQDGRFKTYINDREIDFRVSIMPSIHGEDAVLRVLDKKRGGMQMSLEGLGHHPHIVGAIRDIAREPYGLILVTGPTGSGKSTTLYAMLSEINRGEEKIITIEDPVEYELPGVLQIPVNDKKGLTFARGLRSVLRHDPDKILVGEIRDGETASIAVQAALTGHLVLSSVHANSVFAVLERFVHMAVDLHSFVEALLGVVAQRLIRQICEHCKQPEPMDEALVQASGLTVQAVADWRFCRGAGCPACRNTGYLGRRPIAEVLRMNDALKQAFLQRRPLQETRALAVANGYLSIRQIALRAVAAGETTLQEVNRVTLVE
jgi:general secretion pathway protein E